MKKEIFHKLIDISDDDLIHINDRLVSKRSGVNAKSMSRLLSYVKNEIYARWIAEKESIFFRDKPTEGNKKEK